MALVKFGHMIHGGGMIFLQRCGIAFVMHAVSFLGIHLKLAGSFLVHLYDICTVHIACEDKLLYFVKCLTYKCYCEWYTHSDS